MKTKLLILSVCILTITPQTKPSEESFGLSSSADHAPAGAGTGLTATIPVQQTMLERAPSKLRRNSITRRSSLTRVAPAPEAALNLGATPEVVADSGAPKDADIAGGGYGAAAEALPPAPLRRASAIRAGHRASVAHMPEAITDDTIAELDERITRLDQEMEELRNTLNNPGPYVDVINGEQKFIAMQEELRELIFSRTVALKELPEQFKAPRYPSIFRKCGEYLYYSCDGYQKLPKPIRDNIQMLYQDKPRPEQPTDTVVQVELDGERYGLYRYNGICYARSINPILKNKAHAFLRLTPSAFVALTESELLHISRQSFGKSSEINYWQLYQIDKKIDEGYAAIEKNKQKKRGTRLFIEGFEPYYVFLGAKDNRIYCVQKNQFKLFKAVQNSSEDRFSFTLFSVLIHTAEEVALRSTFSEYKESWCC
jgi:hypothetical protein